MDYYFGIDLGTSSVGWAATNTEYDFLRLKGKNAWGARIFEEAKDCKERRGFRSNKRRIHRRKYRIYLLNHLFAEELNKIDLNFFMRLENSNLLLEDKDAKLGEYSLFKTNKEEKDYYKKYPTIWHLRKALIDGDKDAFSDLRYVYLAIHHILKYRGNFLREGQEFNSGTFDYEILDQIDQFLKSLEQGENSDLTFISKNQGDKIKEIVLMKENKTAKQKEIVKIFDNLNDNNKVYIDLFKTLVTGGKFDLKKITDGDKLEIEFNDKFEENKDSYANILGDAMVIVDVAKQIYDFSVLYNLLGDNTYLSRAMINVYEEHKNQLKDLKGVLKDYCSKSNDYNVFYRVFNKEKYIELNKRNKGFVYDIALDKEIKEDDLIGYYSIKHNNSTKKDGFKTLLIKLNENYFKADVIKINDENFFPLICEKSTSIIPYQLHEMELVSILENAKKYYQFIDDKFICNVKKILKFKIPYYCGPLNDRSEYSNVVRKENETITPWNIDEIIDTNKTKEKFIKRLINNCTYLEGEKVIPKASLLYEEYILLNNLNNLRIGEIGGKNSNRKLDSKIKNELIEYISGLNKKISLKSLEKRIKNIYGNEITITGVDEDITFNRLSYNLFKNHFDIEKERDLVEELIQLATIYADDKEELKKELKSNKELTEEQIKCVLKVQTSKWAPFSKKFLTDIYSNPDENGEIFTIIDLLRTTDKNLQEIIHDEIYGFNTTIENINKEFRGDKSVNKVIQEMLEDTPAKFRRPINQALLILRDVEKAAGCAPKKIFVEVTREDDPVKKGKKKDSRKEELEKFVKSFEKDKEFCNKNNLKTLSNELSEIDENKLKSKMVYLYFKQLGFDLYTGEKMDLNEIINGSGKYDIDHIVPKSLMYNDSIDNTVLVSRYVNQNVKKDFYPIPLDIREKKEIQDLWISLLKKDCISKEKYLRLTRATELTEEELTEFINSQINVVNYSNKVLIDILKAKYPEAKIVFSKAQYPSYIRQEWEIAKFRDLNDAHHAVDAYLNVVAGDILSTKFNDPKNYIYEFKKNKAIKENEKSFNMQNAIYYKLNKNNLYERIKRNSLKRDALITFKNDFNNGAFYKQTINSHCNSTGSLIPVHTKNLSSLEEWKKCCDKYGGYLEMKNAGLILIEYEKKNKKIKKIVGAPLIYEKLYKKIDYEYFKLLLTEEKDLSVIKNVKVIKEIALNQKIRYEGGIYLLKTKGSLNLVNATQNYLNNDSVRYLQYFLKDERLEHVNDGVLDKQVFISNNKEDEDKGKNVVSKERNKQILDELIEKINNKIYDNCIFIRKCREIDFSKFSQASLKNQLKIIKALIILLGRNARYSTLNQEMKKIGVDNVFSSYLYTKSNLSEEFVLINESPSGLFVTKERIDGV